MFDGTVESKDGKLVINGSPINVHARSVNIQGVSQKQQTHPFKFTNLNVCALPLSLSLSLFSTRHILQHEA